MPHEIMYALKGRLAKGCAFACSGVLPLKGYADMHFEADRKTDTSRENFVSTTIASNAAHLGPVERGLRLETLLAARWVIIACQLGCVIFVSFISEFAFPLTLCLAMIVTAIIVNLGTKFSLKPGTRLQDRHAFFQLGFDVLHLSGLLYLTGGLINPFCIYLLGPVLIAASTLRVRETLGLGILVIAAASLLLFIQISLPELSGATLAIGQSPALNQFYVIGVWMSLTSCLVFVGIYIHKMTAENQNLSAALRATELILAKEQHLSAMDGLAAAAAHELGTPLSTIAVVVKELNRDWNTHAEIGPDLALLNSQIVRCRDILGKLTSLNTDNEGPMVALRLTDLINDIVEPFLGYGIKLQISQHSSVSGTDEVPLVKRLPGVIYGLSNLLENAVDFAESQVNIVLAWDNDGILVKIVDDGPGFSESVAARLGEPYVTSRPNSFALDKSLSLEGGGLGLGIFIAKTLLERSGARVDFANALGLQSGADITIIWSPEALIHRQNNNAHRFGDGNHP